MLVQENCIVVCVKRLWTVDQSIFECSSRQKGENFLIFWIINSPVEYIVIKLSAVWPVTMHNIIIIPFSMMNSLMQNIKWPTTYTSVDSKTFYNFQMKKKQSNKLQFFVSLNDDEKNK